MSAPHSHRSPPAQKCPRPARSIAALAADYPALDWAGARACAAAKLRQLRRALPPGGAALLLAARGLVAAATRLGMRRAGQRGQALARGGALPSRVDDLLEEQLFRLASPRCPAAYRALLCCEQRLEDALLRRFAFPHRQQLEALFSQWEDLHRLACFLSLYLGFERQAARMAAAQPARGPRLTKQAAALRALLCMGPRRGKLVFFPAPARAEAT